MRVPDLFTPRVITVVQPDQGNAMRPQPFRKPGPSDSDLVALSNHGLTLRQIAERVGLSHETVRRRLQEVAVSS